MATAFRGPFNSLKETIRVMMVSDGKEFEDTLSSLPIDGLDSASYKTLVVELVTACVLLESKDHLKVVFKMICSFSSLMNLTTPYSQLLLYREVDDSLMIKVFKMMGDDVAMVEVVRDFITLGDTPEAAIGADRCIRLLGPPTAYQLGQIQELLYHHTIDTGEDNHAVDGVLKAWKREIRKPLPLPQYIRTGLKVVDDSHIQELTNEEVLSKFEWSGSYPTDEDILMMRDYLKRSQLAESVHLFRLYGPSNPMLDYLDDSIPCSSLGGCRMLLCRCFEDPSSPRPYEEKAWYRGYCMTCDNILSSPIGAVRRPMRNGGWYGCYCSIDCLIADYNFTSHETGIMRSLGKQLTITSIYDSTVKRSWTLG